MLLVLNDDQKQNILFVCTDMQDKAKQNRNFLVMSSCSPKMKLQLKGWRYVDVVGMQPELHVVVDTITQWELQRCVHSGSGTWSRV